MSPGPAHREEAGGEAKTAAKRIVLSGAFLCASLAAVTWGFGRGFGSSDRRGDLLLQKEQGPPRLTGSERSIAEGETGYSIPSVGVFTGHSSGKKGDKLSFGDGTYFNVFARNPNGMNPEDLKYRAWSKLSKAKDLEYFLKRQKEKNQFFQDSFQNMSESASSEERQLKDGLAALEWRLRRKIGEDIVMLNSTVEGIVRDTQQKLNQQAEAGWARIRKDLATYNDTVRGSVHGQMRSVNEMSVEQSTWVNRVENFLNGFAKRLSGDSAGFDANRQSMGKDVEDVVKDIRFTDARLRQAELARKQVLRNQVLQRNAQAERDLAAYAQNMSVQMQTVILQGQSDLEKKISALQSDMSNKLDTGSKVLADWQTNAATIDAGLQKQMTDLEAILTGASNQEKDSVDKQTAALLAIRGSLVSLETEMHGVYDAMMKQTLPIMQQALEGQKRDLLAKRDAALQLLTSIRQDLKEIDWAVRQTSSRSGLRLDWYISHLKVQLQDLRTRVQRLSVQYGNQGMDVLQTPEVEDR